MMRVVAAATVSVLLMATSAHAVTGTLQVDDHWYTVELDTPMVWRHDIIVLQLPLTSMTNCLRANNDPPLPGPITVRYGAGPQSLFATTAIRTSPIAPHIHIRSTSGDLVCAGGSLAQILLRDGFE